MESEPRGARVSPCSRMLGNSECPCIDPFANLSSGAARLDLGANAPLVPTANCAIIRSGGLCYSSEYGSHGCIMHDLDATPECAEQADHHRPAWCSAQWCYVDAKNCDRPSQASTYFTDAEWNGASLAFSYETCGYVNNFDLIGRIRRAATATRLGKLRIAFPGDSGEGYALVGSKLHTDGSYKVEPGKGVGGTNRSGAVVVFMDNLLQSFSVPWLEVPISARSHEFSPKSTWTACVHEVALGNADMCWANFWVTNSRRALTPFSAPLYIEPFYLIIRREAEPSLVEYLIRPFRPFTPALWLAMFALLAYVGVTLSYQDGQVQSVWECLMGGSFVVAILKGVHAFSQGEVAVDVKTSGVWLTQFVLGFTVLVMVTGYTALVTTQLLQASASRISSMEQAVNMGMTFCAQNIIHADLLARFPGLRAQQLVETYQGAKPDLDRMDDGDCDAAILSGGYWFAARIGNRTHAAVHCGTKVRLPESVATFTIAMPVVDAIARGISWRMDAEVRTGQYMRLEQEAIDNYTVNACVEGQQEADGVLQFGLPEMAGLMLVLFVVSTASLIIDRVGRYIENRSAKLKAAIDTDGDGIVTNAELLRAMSRRSSRSSRAESTAVEPFP